MSRQMSRRLTQVLSHIKCAGRFPARRMVPSVQRLAVPATRLSVGAALAWGSQGGSLGPGLLGRSFCSASAQSLAVEGDKVTMSYVGTLEDGTSFDSGDDLTFVIGDGKLIAGFDQGVRNMTVGETKKVTVSPEQGYGPIRDDLLRKVKVSQLPDGVSVGDKLAVGETGRTALVKELDGEEATLDMNHELAGKTLIFDLTLSGRVPAADVQEQGLRVDEITAGDGVNFPKKGDKLQMHYTGTLVAGGKQFDSSRERGSPFEFTIGVGQVIAAWDQGVMTMSLGQRANLHVPSNLGYGAQGAGGVIPPNADLLFDVELLAINGKTLAGQQGWD